MVEVADLLDHIAHQLDAAERLEDVQRVIRVSARRLVGAQGATFVLLDGDQCYYADEDSMSPLWKGQRFPVDECISGWSMRNRKTVIIPDIHRDDRVPQESYRPTFVRSMIMTPILMPEPVGAIGAYWASAKQPTSEGAATLEALAQLAATALRRFPTGLPDPTFRL